MIVAANKTDILYDPQLLTDFKAHVESLGYQCFEISAAAHIGVRELVNAIAAELAALPPVKVYEPEYVPQAPRIDTSGDVTIEHRDGVWYVEGEWLERMLMSTNFRDPESPELVRPSAALLRPLRPAGTDGHSGRGHRQHVRAGIRIRQIRPQPRGLTGAPRKFFRGAPAFSLRNLRFFCIGFPFGGQEFTNCSGLGAEMRVE